MGDVTRQHTDLRELIQGVIDMVGHLGRYHDKQIEFSQANPVIAPVNAQEIKQVVLNLITNGLDSLAPGGRLRVELRSTAQLGRDRLYRQRLRHDRRSAEAFVRAVLHAATQGRGPGWGFRLPIASSPTTAGRSTCIATGRATDRNSASCCRWQRNRRS